MKQIGAEIGVNESRVSQLHARAIQRLKKALGAAIRPTNSQPGHRVPEHDAPHAHGQGDGERGVVLKYPTPAPEQQERPARCACSVEPLRWEPVSASR